MHWTDKSVILEVKKFRENSGIITVFSEQYGLYSGIARSITSPKLSVIYQIGNIVSVTWKARLSEHLGSLSCEMIESISSFAMFEYKMLLAIKSVSAMLLSLLAERVEEKNIFTELKLLLEAIKVNDKKWLYQYLYFEINLLSHIGFGLDLSKCVLTNSKENLKYISPKSGKAVSESAGESYKDKLFPFLAIFRMENSSANADQLKPALQITGYFLSKALMSISNKNIPVIRSKFIERL